MLESLVQQTLKHWLEMVGLIGVRVVGLLTSDVLEEQWWKMDGEVEVDFDTGWK